MVDQTDRRRQQELVVRENIDAQQVLMMIGRDFPKTLNACRSHFTKLFVAFAAF
jgi:hypothetical protein